jgi:hypothetical protein
MSAYLTSHERALAENVLSGSSGGTTELAQIQTLAEALGATVELHRGKLVVTLPSPTGVAASADRGPTLDVVQVDAFESRWQAAPAVLVVMALQLATGLVSRAEHWTLWLVPWWIWLIGLAPEAVLIVPFVVEPLRLRLHRSDYRATAVRALFGIVRLANALLLIAVVASLISGHERSGGQLLLEALTVLVTNTITFGLWFWTLDSGGPRRRLEPNPPPPDFQFPQQSGPKNGDPLWHPRFFDYLYVSATNSVAFSPTDTMPLTQEAKVLMLSESVVSFLTVVLVFARAVSFFK